MPRRDIFRSHRASEGGEYVEFDLPITEDVGIGGAPFLILLEEGAEDAIVILPRVILGVIVDPDRIGDAPDVPIIVIRRASPLLVLLLPIPHEESDHVVSRLFEEISGYRAVHAAAESDYDLGAHFGRCNSSSVSR